MKQEIKQVDQELITRARRFRTKHSLGQNFLISNSLLGRIAGLATHNRILEIGPGIGFLTDKLLDIADREIYALDLDKTALANLAPHPRLRKIHGDALTYDFQQLANYGAYQIVGNLPFNVGTQIFTRLIGDLETDNWAFSGITDMILMFQLEVAHRLSAKPHTKAYNYLSMLASTKADLEFLFEVPSNAFYPEPKVKAGVLRIKPRPSKLAGIKIEDRLALKKFIKLAFTQRRKIIKNSLSCYGIKDYLGLENKRPEELTLEDFMTLYFSQT